MSGKTFNKETSYTLIVNRRELYDAALEHHYDHVVLMEDYALSQDDIATILANGNVAFGLIYEEGDPDSIQFGQQIYENGTKYLCWEFPNDTDIYHGNPMRSVQDLVDDFPERREIEILLVGRGYLLCTDYTDRCGNCHKVLDEGDKYCRYCGTKRGEGRFLPFENPMYALYGAPTLKKYYCQNCLNEWKIRVFFDEESTHCPNCGQSTVKMIRSKILYGWPIQNDDG